MDRRRLGMLALFGGALVVVLVLASSLHGVVLEPGRPIRLDAAFRLANPTGTAVSDSRPAPPWFAVAVGASLVLFVLGLIFSRSLRRDLLRNLPIYALMILGFYLLSRTLGQNNGPSREAAPIAPAGEQPLAPDQSPVPDFVNQPPEWMVIGVTLVIAAALLAVLWLVVRRLRRPPEPLARIVEEAREALADLRAGGDLRDTITRCYAEMVNVFRETRGMGRDQTLTPREFEQRLAAAGLDDRHIQRLTRLFELVRYSQRTPGERDEREAQECLEAIIQAYGHEERAARATSLHTS